MLKVAWKKTKEHCCHVCEKQFDWDELSHVFQELIKDPQGRLVMKETYTCSPKCFQDLQYQLSQKQS